jgi:hypothetical protein
LGCFFFLPAIETGNGIFQEFDGLDARKWVIYDSGIRGHMIELTCAKCRHVLKVDNAFAGGVCRCSRCGAIQTVPVRRRSMAPVPASPADSTAGSSFAGLPSPAASGLDELADIISSSTLTGTGLAYNRVQSSIPVEVAPTPLPQRVPQAVVVVSASVGLVIIALLGVIIYLLLAVAPPAATELELVTEPAFCGVPIGGRSVIYVLDRGSATQEGFDYLKAACVRSIRTLGDRRRFQVIFWDNGTGPAAWPADSLTAATPPALEEARRELERAYPFGQSVAESALIRALDQKPDVIVLATGKGWDLQDDFVSMVMQLHKRSPRTQIHTFAIGSSGDSRALATIAERTGGNYQEFPISRLRAFSY